MGSPRWVPAPRVWPLLLLLGFGALDLAHAQNATAAGPVGTYMGCFVDAAAPNRDLNVTAMLAEPKLTQQMCSARCANYTYFGLEMGNECYCGDNFGRLGAAAWTDCYMVASGNASQVGGGGWRISVFSKVNLVSTRPLDNNMARGKLTSQSSTGYSGVSSRAVDGNTNGDWWQNSCTHTADTDATPWWQVDLGSKMPIWTVRVWNRLDCCDTRLRNFQVLVDGVLQTPRYFPAPAAGGSIDINLGGVLGQVVKIQKSTAVLTLCEVQIETIQPGPFQGHPTCEPTKRIPGDIQYAFDTGCGCPVGYINQNNKCEINANITSLCESGDPCSTDQLCVDGRGNNITEYGYMCTCKTGLDQNGDCDVGTLGVKRVTSYGTDVCHTSYRITTVDATGVSVGQCRLRCLTTSTCTIFTYNGATETCYGYANCNTRMAGGSDWNIYQVIPRCRSGMHSCDPQTQDCVETDSGYDCVWKENILPRTACGPGMGLKLIAPNSTCTVNAQYITQSTGTSLMDCRKACLTTASCRNIQYTFGSASSQMGTCMLFKNCTMAPGTQNMPAVYEVIDYCKSGQHLCTAAESCVDKYDSVPPYECVWNQLPANDTTCPVAHGLQVYSLSKMCSTSVGLITLYYNILPAECRRNCINQGGNCKFMTYGYGPTQLGLCQIFSTCSLVNNTVPNQVVYEVLDYCRSGQHKCTAEQQCIQRFTGNQAYECVWRTSPLTNHTCNYPAGLDLLSSNATCAAVDVLADVAQENLLDCRTRCLQNTACRFIQVHFNEDGSHGRCVLLKNCTLAAPSAGSVVYRVIDFCASGTHKCVEPKMCINRYGKSPAYECVEADFATNQKCDAAPGIKLYKYNTNCAVAQVNSATGQTLRSCRLLCLKTAGCRYFTYMHREPYMGYCYAYPSCATTTARTDGAATYELLDYCGSGLHNCTAGQMCTNRHYGEQAYECVWNTRPVNNTCQLAGGLRMIYNNNTVCSPSNYQGQYANLNLADCRTKCRNTANCKFIIAWNEWPKAGYCNLYNACNANQTVLTAATWENTTTYEVIDFCTSGLHQCSGPDKCYAKDGYADAYECAWSDVTDNYSTCALQAGARLLGSDRSCSTTIAGNHLGDYNSYNLRDCRNQCRKTAGCQYFAVAYGATNTGLCRLFKACNGTALVTGPTGANNEFSAYELIDYCKTGQHKCSPEQMCQDKEGEIQGYECTWRNTPSASSTCMVVAGARQFNGSSVGMCTSSPQTNFVGLTAKQCRTACFKQAGCNYFSYVYGSPYIGYCFLYATCPSLNPAGYGNAPTTTYQLIDYCKSGLHNCNGESEMCVDRWDMDQSYECVFRDTPNPNSTCANVLGVSLVRTNISCNGWIIYKSGINMRECRNLCRTYWSSNCRLYQYVFSGAQTSFCSIHTEAQCANATLVTNGYSPQSAIYRVTDVCAPGNHNCSATQRCFPKDLDTQAYDCGYKDTPLDNSTAASSLGLRLIATNMSCTESAITTVATGKSLQDCREVCYAYWGSNCRFARYTFAGSNAGYCYIYTSCTKKTTADATDPVSAVYRVTDPCAEGTHNCSSTQMCARMTYGNQSYECIYRDTPMENSTCAVSAGLRLVGVNRTCSGTAITSKSGISLRECRDLCFSNAANNCKFISYVFSGASVAVCYVYSTCSTYAAYNAALTPFAATYEIIDYCGTGLHKCDQETEVCVRKASGTQAYECLTRDMPTNTSSCTASMGMRSISTNYTCGDAQVVATPNPATGITLLECRNYCRQFATCRYVSYVYSGIYTGNCYLYGTCATKGAYNKDLTPFAFTYEVMDYCTRGGHNCVADRQCFPLKLNYQAYECLYREVPQLNTTTTDAGPLGLRFVISNRSCTESYLGQTTGLSLRDCRIKCLQTANCKRIQFQHSGTYVGYCHTYSTCTPNTAYDATWAPNNAIYDVIDYCAAGNHNCTTRQMCVPDYYGQTGYKCQYPEVPQNSTCIESLGLKVHARNISCSNGAVASATGVSLKECRNLCITNWAAGCRYVVYVHAGPSVGNCWSYGAAGCVNTGGYSATVQPYIIGYNITNPWQGGNHTCRSDQLVMNRPYGSMQYDCGYHDIPSNTSTCALAIGLKRVQNITVCNTATNYIASYTLRNINQCRALCTGTCKFISYYFTGPNVGLCYLYTNCTGPAAWNANNLNARSYELVAVDTANANCTPQLKCTENHDFASCGTDDINGSGMRLRSRNQTCSETYRTAEFSGLSLMGCRQGCANAVNCRYFTYIPDHPTTYFGYCRYYLRCDLAAPQFPNMLSYELIDPTPAPIDAYNTCTNQQKCTELGEIEACGGEPNTSGAAPVWPSFDRMCADSFTISNTAGFTFASCRAACQNYATCKAFSFNFHGLYQGYCRLATDCTSFKDLEQPGFRSYWLRRLPEQLPYDYPQQRKCTEFMDPEACGTGNTTDLGAELVSLNQTCNETFKIEETSGQTFSKCQNRCIQRSDCTHFSFFFSGFNSMYSYCRLYSSCSSLQTPTNFGVYSFKRVATPVTIPENCTLQQRCTEFQEPASCNANLTGLGAELMHPNLTCVETGRLAQLNFRSFARCRQACLDRPDCTHFSVWYKGTNNLYGYCRLYPSCTLAAPEYVGMLSYRPTWTQKKEPETCTSTQNCTELQEGPECSRDPNSGGSLMSLNETCDETQRITQINSFSWSQCRQKCMNTAGCTHFSFFWHGFNNLQGYCRLFKDCSVLKKPEYVGMLSYRLTPTTPMLPVPGTKQQRCTETHEPSNCDQPDTGAEPAGNLTHLCYSGPTELAWLIPTSFSECRDKCRNTYGCTHFLYHHSSISGYFGGCSLQKGCVMSARPSPDNLSRSYRLLDLPIMLPYDQSNCTAQQRCSELNEFQFCNTSGSAAELVHPSQVCLETNRIAQVATFSFSMCRTQCVNTPGCTHFTYFFGGLDGVQGYCRTYRSCDTLQAPEYKDMRSYKVLAPIRSYQQNCTEQQRCIELNDLTKCSNNSDVDDGLELVPGGANAYCDITYRINYAGAMSLMQCRAWCEATPFCNYISYWHNGGSIGSCWIYRWCGTPAPNNPGTYSYKVLDTPAIEPNTCNDRQACFELNNATACNGTGVTGLELLANNMTCTEAERMPGDISAVTLMACRLACLNKPGCKFINYFHRQPNVGLCRFYTACNLAPNTAYAAVPAVYRVAGMPSKVTTTDCTNQTRCLEFGDSTSCAGPGSGLKLLSYNTTCLETNKLGGDVSLVSLMKCREACVNTPTCRFVSYFHGAGATGLCRLYATCVLQTTGTNGVASYEVIDTPRMLSQSCTQSEICHVHQNYTLCARNMSGLLFVGPNIVCSEARMAEWYTSLSDCRQKCVNTKNCNFLNYYTIDTPHLCRIFQQCTWTNTTSKGVLGYQVTLTSAMENGTCTNQTQCMEYANLTFCDGVAAGARIIPESLNVSNPRHCDTVTYLQLFDKVSFNTCRERCANHLQCARFTYYRDQPYNGRCFLHGPCTLVAQIYGGMSFDILPTAQMLPRTCSQQQQCTELMNRTQCGAGTGLVYWTNGPNLATSTNMVCSQSANLLVLYTGKTLLECRQLCRNTATCQFITYHFRNTYMGYCFLLSECTQNQNTMDAISYRVIDTPLRMNSTCKNAQETCTESQDPRACGQPGSGLDILLSNNATIMCAVATRVATFNRQSIQGCRNKCVNYAGCTSITYVSKGTSTGSCYLHKDCGTPTTPPDGYTSYNLLDMTPPVTDIEFGPKSIDGYRYRGFLAKYYTQRTSGTKVYGPSDLHFARLEHTVRKTASQQPLEGPVVGEFGQTIAAYDRWTRVTFNGTYIKPVVFVSPVPSNTSTQPLQAAIRQVTPTGFIVRVNIPPCAAQPDTEARMIGWIVMEEGQHVLADGRLVFVGKVAVPVNYDISKPVKIRLPEVLISKSPAVIVNVQDATDKDFFQAGFVNEVWALAVRPANSGVTSRVRALGFMYFETKETSLFGTNGGAGGFNQTNNSSREALFSGNAIVRGQYQYAFVTPQLTPIKAPLSDVNINSPTGNDTAAPTQQTGEIPAVPLAVPQLDWGKYGGAWWEGLQVFMAPTGCGEKNRTTMADIRYSYLVVGDRTDNMVRLRGFGALAANNNFGSTTKYVEYSAVVACPSLNSDISVRMIASQSANMIQLEASVVVNTTTASNATFIVPCANSSTGIFKLFLYHWENGAGASVRLLWRRDGDDDFVPITSHYTVPGSGPGIFVSENNVITTGPTSKQTTFKVRLLAPPRNNVIVSFNNPLAPDLFGCETCTLAFTQANWDIDQVVYAGPVSRLSIRPMIQGAVAMWLTSASDQPTYNNKVGVLLNLNPTSLSITAGVGGRRSIGGRIGSCHSSGDPHLLTWDGAYFDMYPPYSGNPEGWYYLVKDANNQFVVQTLITHIYNKMFAIKYRSTTIVMYSGGFKVLRGSLSGWSVVPGEAHLPNGARIRYTGGSLYLNVDIEIPPTYCGCVNGACGNWDLEPESWKWQMSYADWVVPREDALINYPATTFAKTISLGILRTVHSGAQCPDIPPSPAPAPLPPPPPRPNGPPAPPAEVVPAPRDFVAYRSCYQGADTTPVSSQTTTAANTTTTNNATSVPLAGVDSQLISKEDAAITLQASIYGVNPAGDTGGFEEEAAVAGPAEGEAISSDLADLLNAIVPGAAGGATDVEAAGQVQTFDVPEPSTETIELCKKRAYEIMDAKKCPLSTDSVAKHVESCVTDATIEHVGPEDVHLGTLVGECNAYLLAKLQAAAASCIGANQKFDGVNCINVSTCGPGCGDPVNQCVDGNCVCAQGFFGTFCENAVAAFDPCSSPNACLNGGKCTAILDGTDFECACVDPFFGPKCEDKDECKLGQHTCDKVNGDCINTVGSFRCQCNAGYVASNDTTVCTAFCNVLPPLCKNNATCQPTVDANGNADYNCTCDYGWQGRICDVPVPPTGGIKGKLFFDANNNGVQDDIIQEPAMVFTRLALIEVTSNRTVAYNRTDNLGNYEFNKILPGNYNVVVDTTTLPKPEDLQVPSLLSKLTPMPAPPKYNISVNYTGSGNGSNVPVVSVLPMDEVQLNTALILAAKQMTDATKTGVTKELFGGDRVLMLAVLNASTAETYIPALNETDKLRAMSLLFSSLASNSETLGIMYAIMPEVFLPPPNITNTSVSALPSSTSAPVQTSGPAVDENGFLLEETRRRREILAEVGPIVEILHFQRSRRQTAQNLTMSNTTTTNSTNSTYSPLTGPTNATVKVVAQQVAVANFDYTSDVASPCNTGTHVCTAQATCVSTATGYYCGCPVGFDGDGTTTGTGCTDVNECTTLGPCAQPGGYCTNNVGSFSCACLSPYTGDGFNCTCPAGANCDNATLPTTTTTTTTTTSAAAATTTGTGTGAQATTAGGTTTAANTPAGTGTAAGTTSGTDAQAGATTSTAAGTTSGTDAQAGATTSTAAGSSTGTNQPAGTTTTTEGAGATTSAGSGATTTANAGTGAPGSTSTAGGSTPAATGKTTTGAGSGPTTTGTAGSNVSGGSAQVSAASTPKQPPSNCFVGDGTSDFTVKFGNAGGTAAFAQSAQSVFGITDTNDGGYCLEVDSPIYGKFLYNCEHPKSALSGTYTAATKKFSISGSLVRCHPGWSKANCDAFIAANGVCDINFSYTLTSVNGTLRHLDAVSPGGGTITCKQETITYSGKISVTHTFEVGLTTGSKGNNGIGWLVFPSEMTRQGDWLFSIYC